MAGDPQCVRVLGPFRQAPAQQGSRDNHAAPDSMHRDGGMEGDEEAQRGGLGVGGWCDKELRKVEDMTRRSRQVQVEIIKDELKRDGWRGRKRQCRSRGGERRSSKRKKEQARER